MKKNCYMIITPAKNEERLLPFLIESVVNQSVLPRRWIIVDDGSTDSTGEQIDAAAEKHTWIQPHHVTPDPVRKRGGASVVMQYLRPDLVTDVDYVLRLDADLSFRADFAELLLAEFERDKRLGIAGAVLLERHGRRLCPIRLPTYHVRGATKMYSRECLQAIGGLKGGPGWDSIDETRATMLGYRTRSFRHVTAIHHRPLGGADGQWRIWLAAGRANYHAGYSPLFLTARAVRKALCAPPVIGGLLLIAGYTRAYLRGEAKGAEPDLVRYVRRQQLRRMLLLNSALR